MLMKEIQELDLVNEEVKKLDNDSPSIINKSFTRRISAKNTKVKEPSKKQQKRNLNDLLKEYIEDKD